MVHSVTRHLLGIAFRHIDRGDARLMVQCTSGRLHSVSPPPCRIEMAPGLRVRHRLTDTGALRQALVRVAAAEESCEFSRLKLLLLHLRQVVIGHDVLL